MGIRRPYHEVKAFCGAVTPFVRFCSEFLSADLCFEAVDTGLASNEGLELAKHARGRMVELIQLCNQVK